MSVETLALVLHHSRSAGTDKLVLLGIANHAGDGGAWPSIGTLAKYANATERSVQRSIGKLVNLGELARHVQAGGTLTSHAHPSTRPNRYDVLVSCPAWCDRTPQHKPLPGWQQGQDGSYAQPLAPLPGMPGSGTSDRVTLVSPGDAGVTRGGDAGVTLTIHRTDRGQVSAEPQDAREAVDDSLSSRRPQPAAAATESHRAAMLKAARDQLDTAKGSTA